MSNNVECKDMPNDLSTTVGDSHNPKQPTAIDLVDKTIREISGRDFVSSSEVTDLLLDIRLFLITQPAKEVV